MKLALPVRALPIIAVSLLAACVPPGARPEPLPAPEPVAAPPQQVQRPVQRPAPQPRAPVLAPRPMPAPAAPSSTALAAWADAPLSPGRWAYQGGRGASRALFGPAAAPSFQVACAGRVLTLTRTSAAAGALTIRTSSTARTLPGAAGVQGLQVQLTAGDPLLDAIVFSRGRFAVEAPGVPALVIPTWPEFARVVEDCRR